MLFLRPFGSKRHPTGCRARGQKEKICVIRVICVRFIIREIRGICGRKKIINVAITILTAIATTITTASCVGIEDWGASLKILGRQVAKNL